MKDTTQNGDAGKPPPEFAIIPRHIWLDRSLTNADRAVYDALASHCGGEDKRECWPGTETLVAISGVTAGTVSKPLAWLMHCGHVERWKGSRQMPDGRQAVVTNYRLAWSNDSHATDKDRAVFFQMRHGSRRAREFPSVEISPGGNSTGGNHEVSTDGKQAVSTGEIQKFPYGETHKNRPAEQTKLDQTRHNNTHTAPTAASQTADDRIAKEFEQRSGQPFSGKSHDGAQDNRIRISLDLAPPEQLYRMKQYREAADGEKQANADWREFLSERLKQDPEWIAAYPHTYLGRFREFVWGRGIRREQAAKEAQQQQAAAQKVEMNWEWFKSADAQKAREHGYKKLYEEDADTALEKFVRKHWGKQATKREWLFEAANWLDNEHRWMREKGMEVLA